MLITCGNPSCPLPGGKFPRKSNRQKYCGLRCAGLMTPARARSPYVESEAEVEALWLKVRAQRKHRPRPTIDPWAMPGGMQQYVGGLEL